MVCFPSSCCVRCLPHLRSKRRETCTEAAACSNRRRKCASDPSPESQETGGFLAIQAPADPFTDDFTSSRQNRGFSALRGRCGSCQSLGGKSDFSCNLVRVMQNNAICASLAGTFPRISWELGAASLGEIIRVPRERTLRSPLSLSPFTSARNILLLKRETTTGTALFVPVFDPISPRKYLSRHHISHLDPPYHLTAATTAAQGGAWSPHRGHL